ncbi:MAG: leucine-rich repeat domain-containing protein [Oscillospiraceae bacterium]|nr:leucine-rich repeat domain-containing protein [Oscillospiraceae bacterium]
MAYFQWRKLVYFSLPLTISQIQISESLSLLPDGIFGRTGISQITVPGNISKVRCAFFECPNLRSVELQEGARSLWESFAGCSVLETVTLTETWGFFRVTPLLAVHR